MTAFLPTVFQCLTSIFGGHTFAETVFVLSLLVTWLIRAFHELGYFAFNFLSEKGFKYKENLRKNGTIIYPKVPLRQKDEIVFTMSKYILKLSASKASPKDMETAAFDLRVATY